MVGYDLIPGYHLVVLDRVISMYFPRIEDLRVDRDLRQKDVAEYLNMDPEVYRRYEKGIREIPVWALIKLAKYYNTSTDYILGLTNSKRPAKG